MRQLVNVVLEYGVGKWKDMKTKYFFASIRTPVHWQVHTHDILLGTHYTM